MSKQILCFIFLLIFTSYIDVAKADNSDDEKAKDCDKEEYCHQNDAPEAKEPKPQAKECEKLLEVRAALLATREKRDASPERQACIEKLPNGYSVSICDAEIYQNLDTKIDKSETDILSFNQTAHPNHCGTTLIEAWQ